MARVMFPIENCDAIFCTLEGKFSIRKQNVVMIDHVIFKIYSKGFSSHCSVQYGTSGLIISKVLTGLL